MLRSVLERARRDLDAGKNLVNEAQLFLERWWEINRRDELETGGTGISEDRDAENVRERLTGLLRDLEVIANRINDQLGNIASATAGLLPPAPLAAPLEAPLFDEVRREAEDELLLPADQEKWADAFAIEAGPWAVHLTGTALPTPQLAINLRANLGGATLMRPFLTLVRPAQGFETVNLDSDGSGKIALPRGDSIMLVQGDEVWEVRLSFRNL
jgi:hypothetical protein